jgi:hypothetical protein
MDMPGSTFLLNPVAELRHQQQVVTVIDVDCEGVTGMRSGEQRGLHYAF